MRLPRVRFTVRAMMVAVAVFAIVFRGVATSPVLGLLACFVAAPLAGATWSGTRYRLGRLDPISGGMLAGALQTPLVLMIALFLTSPGPGGSIVEFVCELGPIILSAGMLVGLVAGVLVSFCVVLLPLPTGNAAPADVVPVADTPEL